AIPTPDAQEFKTCRFEYSLFPHRKGWRESNSFRPAYEFNYGLSGFQLPKVRKGKRTLPSHLSFVTLNPENLILVTFKKAEDAGEVILRFFETKGERAKAEISLFREPTSVERVNLLEEEDEGGKITWRGRKISLPVKPFEIVSLKLRF
ncbi:MAG: glycosyl hydrolase-related protein, partial [Pseudomonadota bacterium]